MYAHLGVRIIRDDIDVEDAQNVYNLKVEVGQYMVMYHSTESELTASIMRDRKEVEEFFKSQLDDLDASLIQH